MSIFSFETPYLKRAIPYDENLWIGVVLCVLLTLCAFWYGGWWTWQNHLFADHSREMEALVIHKYIAVGQGKHGPTYTPHIQYGYQVGNLIVNCDVSVHRDIFDQVAEGHGMPIKYLPEDPSDNRLDDSGDDFQDRMKANLGLISGLAGLVFTIASALRADRRKKVLTRLKTVGFSTRGQVTSVDTERSGKAMVTFLRLEFTDNLGRTVSGRTSALTAKQEKLWRQDMKIKVYYDPNDSSVFTVNPNRSDFEGGNE